MASKVSTVVFDKTGTLTQGKAAVVHCSTVAASNGGAAGGTVVEGSSTSAQHTEAGLLHMAEAIESNSEHIIAAAIVDYCRSRQPPSSSSSASAVAVDDGSFVATAGKGVACTVAGEQVRMGSISWIQRTRTVSTTAGGGGSLSLERQVAELQRKGQTVVALEVSGAVRMLFGVGDAPRPEAAAVIGALRERGVKVLMLTGDNVRTARAVASALGLDADAGEVHAEMLPAHKSAVVEELQKQHGEVVAMVGDGVNDAPALAQADVGISVGTGTEIATAQADIVLIKSNMLDVLTALDLASCVVGRIRMNLCWALGYNVLLIPFAAGLLFPFVHCTLPPQMAGLAMAMSSVSVVCSSLSLKWYQKPLLCRQYEEQQRLEADGSTAGNNKMKGSRNMRIAQKFSISRNKKDQTYKPVPVAQEDNPSDEEDDTELASFI
jgi:Cu+-exporting ATPase